LYKKKELSGNKLIYSNKTSEDVIMDKELKKMLKEDYVKIYTRQNVIGFVSRRIDRNYLIENIVDFNQHFYVCGTSDFVKSITGYLIDLGVTANSLVIEN
jgi:ferredoxin-NADP reductase